jgi:hypothetical protein
MKSRQLLLKALSVLSQVSSGHPPGDEEVALLRQHAMPNEGKLKIDALARAIIRRESHKTLPVPRG